MAPPTATITTTTTTKMPGRRAPRAGAKRPFKRIARALLEQRQFFKSISQQALELNETLLADNANLWTENTRLQARPEFAFTFAAGSGPGAAAAEVEPLTSEQLDFDWDAWIDPAQYSAEASSSENLGQIFADETMPQSPSPAGERSSREQMMTDDSAEVSRCREEIADLTTRLESCQTQLASYEEQAQEYHNTARSNEQLKQELQHERTTRQQVESTLEHFQLQYRNERSNLANIVSPGIDFPDHQSAHEHVGQAIEQLRRDIASLNTTKSDLEALLITARAQNDGESLRAHNLQQQNETIQAHLDANIAQFKDSLTVTEAQQAVSDAVSDLSTQCDEAHQETSILREENANQKEELENLRRFKEQYSSPTARTHRRNASSRPGSMVLGATNLQDEISSAAVSGDDIDDSFSILQQQPQPLAIGAIMSVEFAPASPTRPALNHSSIMTQESTPKTPQRPGTPSPPTLALSEVITQELAPHSIPRPALSLAPILTQDVQPQSPQAQRLSFSALSQQSNAPKRRFPLAKPRVYSGLPPEIQELFDREAKRFRFSPVTTVYEQTPLSPNTRMTKHSATSTASAEKPAISVATQADMPSSLPHMSTSATVLSLVLVFLFMLLARICATRFAFYNAMRTANTITDWNTRDSGYSIVSYASPYHPSLGIAVHDVIWGVLHVLFSLFGASDKASLMHYRIATWWSGVHGLDFA